MGEEKGEIIKKNKGRQKIRIEPIESRSNLQVTFSKRKAGLINKASELSILCGCDVGIISFTPGNKPFAFANPDVHSVINRFLKETCYGDCTNSSIRPSHSSAHTHPVLHKEYDNSFKMFDTPRNIECFDRKNDEQFWWDKSVDDMSLEELLNFRTNLKNLKIDVLARINQLDEQNAHP